jgi:hypothetical protein
MRRSLAGIVVLIALAGGARAESVSDITAPGLPGTEQDVAFDVHMQGIDLEAPDLVFIHKGGKQRGASVGFHVAAPGHRKDGTFVPTNSSSIPEAEVVSYRLARFLGVSRFYHPVTYYQLGPQASARFKALLQKHGEIYENRKENRSRSLAELKVHPDHIFGIYRLRADGKLYVASSLGGEGQPNYSHPLMSHIRADRPLPPATPMSLPGVKPARAGYPKPSEKESELARQLSIILTIDQLMGQWDRFWKNLEAVGDKDGRLRLIARDNGGADVDDGWEWHVSYQKMLSRYDRDVMQRLVGLNAFLRGKTATLGEFKSVDSWKATVGFRKASSFNTFKRKLELLVDKTLPAREKQFGDKIYFAAE